MHDDDVPVRCGYYEPWPIVYNDALQSLDKVEKLDQFLSLDDDPMWQVYASGIANKDISVVAIGFEETPKMNTLGNNVWISEADHQFMNRVIKYTPTINNRIKQIIPYTRQSFIDGVSPAMGAWMQFMPPVWCAYYLRSGGVVIKDWTTIPQYYPSANQLFNGHQNPPFCFTPGWSILQCWGDGIETADILNAQGTYTFLDFNVANFTPAEMITWAGGTVVPTPQPQPQPAPQPVTDLTALQAAVTDLQTRLSAMEAWRTGVNTWISQEPK
jgi:hypothetical protein